MTGVIWMYRFMPLSKIYTITIMIIIAIGIMIELHHELSFTACMGPACYAACGVYFLSLGDSITRHLFSHNFLQSSLLCLTNATGIAIWLVCGLAVRK